MRISTNHNELRPLHNCVPTADPSLRAAALEEVIPKRDCRTYRGDVGSQPRCAKSV